MRQIAIAILVLTAVGYACWPRFARVRYGRSLYRCYNQIHTLANGVLAYEKEHGHYPPPYVVDSTGTPMHSWRVLILPYIGESELFAKYNFDEPWYGPNNSMLESQMPAVYRCPEDDLTSNTTSYLAVVGAETIWNSKQPVTRHEITDGVTDTILFAEYGNHRTRWMQPVDIPHEELVRSKILPNSTHDDDDWVVAYADGYVEVVDTIPWTLFAGMVTIAGGETIDADQITAR